MASMDKHTQTNETARKRKLRDKAHLSTKEAAEYLGVSLTTIKSRAYSRDVPSFKLGKRLLFRRSDLDTYVDSLIKSRM